MTEKGEESKSLLVGKEEDITTRGQSYDEEGQVIMNIKNVKLIIESSDDESDGAETALMITEGKGNFKCVIHKNEMYNQKMDESWEV